MNLEANKPEIELVVSYDVKTGKTTRHDYRFDAVRELVKDPSLRVTDIAMKTGYNKGHVSRLRKEAKLNDVIAQTVVKDREACASKGASMNMDDIKEAIEVLEDASADMRMETGDKDYYREAIAILRQAIEQTQKKTAVSPDGGKGFIDGVWHCQCGKSYEVTCISSKPKGQA